MRIQGCGLKKAVLVDSVELHARPVVWKIGWAIGAERIHVPQRIHNAGMYVSGKRPICHVIMQLFRRVAPYGLRIELASYR